MSCISLLDIAVQFNYFHPRPTEFDMNIEIDLVGYNSVAEIRNLLSVLAGNAHFIFLYTQVWIKWKPDTLNM